MSTPSVDSESPSSVVPSSRSARPILVVDDDAVSRHVLGLALSRANLAYVAFGSASDALSYLEAGHVAELVLLDLVMPDMDGYALLQQIRANPLTQRLPIVVLTGAGADEEVTRVFAAGADDFVKKPFRADELVARVRGQLRLCAVQAELRQRERDLQIVLEITQVLASNLDMRGILQTVVQRIAEVAQIDRVSIVLTHDSAHGVVVAASDDERIRDLRIELARYPEIAEVLRTGAPLLIDDAHNHPLLGELGTVPKTLQSLALVPIVHEGEQIGVLFLRARARRCFASREIDLCCTIASAMAVALSNAQRFQELREQTQKVTFERSEAERKARSLQRFADFFECSGDGMIVLDQHGALLVSNRRAREVTGYADIDFAGRRLLDVVQISDLEWSDVLRDLQSDDYASEIDLKFVTSWGEQRIASASSVLLDEGFIICVFRDVTEARAMEAELVRTKEYLQQVIDASFDAIVSTTTDGTLVIYNRAAEALFGFPRGQVIGKPISRVYPRESAREMIRLIRANNGQVVGANIDVVDAEGVSIPVSFSGALVRAGERVLGALGVYTDLRERKHMERTLEEARATLLRKERDAAVVALAGATAHELNQPLQSVLGLSELIARKLERGEQAQALSSLEKLREQALRMAEIVRKIGTLTHYETKSYVGAAEILDLDRASVGGGAGGEGDAP